MTGREDGKENDLFFTCSLIEYIARKTKNKRSDTVDCLGRTAIEKIYDLADVYHSDNIETVSDEFIEKYGLKEGTFDNVSAAKYAVPSYWDIYHSFVTDKIEDYNSSFYYDALQNILNAFLDGKIE